ncbi:MAG: efflux RND transporter periplasmic adaptor subunit [Proteobacteria bacterium]|nr:efflux RND transporter periplasmic adaptor subunit [Pseudomonadota bacterium]MBU1742659.1 efflux RND transporter periplasmic adaptor subunit [Pseudomonadota bacterium]
MLQKSIDPALGRPGRGLGAKWWWLVLWPALLLALACGSQGGSRGATFKKAKARRMTIAKIVQCTGTVKAQVGAEVKVGSRVSGRVEKLFVRAGQQVKGPVGNQLGEVVAIIERAELQAKRDEVRAELKVLEAKLAAIEATMPAEIKKAEAGVAEVEAEVRNASRALRRQLSLGRKGFAAQEAVDNARKAFDVARARLASAKQQLAYLKFKMRTDLMVSRAQVQQAEVKLRTAQITLDYATIRAPITGVVGSVTTQEGETVAASLSAPTFITIIDLSRLQVDASVDETDIGLVETGQTVTFVVDAHPDKLFKGRIRAIQPQATVQQDVVYYIVEVDIISPYKGLLRPMMTANVSIKVGTRHNVVAVPGQAVRRLPGGRTIVLVPGPEGKPKGRPVQIGWSSGGWTQIVRGVAPGEVVLVPTRTARAGARRPGR